MKDQVFAVLSNARRRRLLLRLHDADGDDPTLEIPGDVVEDGEDVDRLSVTLRHSHLPQLAEHAFVEVKRDGARVGRGANFDDVRPYLEVLARDGDSSDHTRVETSS